MTTIEKFEESLQKLVVFLKAHPTLKTNESLPYRIYAVRRPPFEKKIFQISFYDDTARKE